MVRIGPSRLMWFRPSIGSFTARQGNGRNLRPGAGPGAREDLDRLFPGGSAQYLSLVAALAVISSIPWSIVSGIATLSEAVGMGVFGSLLLAAVRGQLSLVMLHNAIMRTGTLIAMVFFIVVGATVFSLSFHLVA
tara:strand:+ start:40 stop:444 length:405 start_codon:yes stop_codon:yes gene_type:complete